MIKYLFSPVIASICVFSFSLTANADCSKPQPPILPNGDIPEYCPIPVPQQTITPAKITPTPALPGSARAIWVIENNNRLRDLEWVAETNRELYWQKYSEYLAWLKRTNPSAYAQEMQNLNQMSEGVSALLRYLEKHPLLVKP